MLILQSWLLQIGNLYPDTMILYMLTVKLTTYFVCFPAMAIALGNLYHDDIDVDKEQVAGVLAAASVLQFKALIKL